MNYGPLSRMVVYGAESQTTVGGLLLNTFHAIECGFASELGIRKAVMPQLIAGQS
jgi:hypothetical protein